jgi:hypothetical protein
MTFVTRAISGIGYNKSMLDFTPNRDHHEQEQKIKDFHDTPCIICGRGVKDPWKYTVHIFWGFTVVTKEEAETLPESANLGAWPIGSYCLKKHPEILPYVIKE